MPRGRAAHRRLTRRFDCTLVGIPLASRHKARAGRKVMPGRAVEQSELGLEVVVANPSHVRWIYGSKTRADGFDAEALARLARVDVTLLHPVTHRSRQAQADLVLLQTRDAIVDGSTTVVEGDGDVAVPQNENNTTVTFDEATDGTPIEGDLLIDGNNVAVYGNGIDATVIKGDVVLDGNNVRLRGLTIDGNLTVPKNSLAIVFVKVTGDVLISGNNCVFTGSDVFGDMTVTGNNSVLVQNRVQGAFAVSGSADACTDNAAFADGNEDGVVDVTEVGDELVCGG